MVVVVVVVVLAVWETGRCCRASEWNERACWPAAKSASGRRNPGNGEFG
jgi:hypothetical protein